ncbi:hypothetical protein [Cohnella lupini]|uniref:Uncharacterized protein n=1 Tax=Cohnella lupini TaxID=1294267 RepID=A0A3D9I6A0_9BACL|nr:hypothetical protein [Cohnella lupini]RED57175.1 hypothetical protein DFP95_11189 [Cohnella lupini]
MITATVTFHRNSDRHIDAYGISLHRDMRKTYAIASVFLDEPLGVNDAVRDAMATAAIISRDNTCDVLVIGSEKPFKHPASRARFEKSVVSVRARMQFSYNPPRKKDSQRYARDAAIRKTTIIEKFEEE